MSRPHPVTEDVLHLQDLFLMRQARSVDLKDRASRKDSNTRLQTFYFALQQILKPDMSLEIGAHLADFSRHMAGEGVEAHAFEANPYNYQAFVGRIKESAPAVHYHHLAISDTDGEVTFHVKESKGDKALNKVAGNNSLLVRSDDSFLYEKVTVPSRRLDSFLAEGGLTGRTFSAWIDVEGALGPVTKGFGGALETCLSLMVEVEEVAYWQGQMLVFDAMRYFAEQGLVPVARDFEYSDQFNLVYLRKDMLLHPEVRLTLTKFLQST